MLSYVILCCYESSWVHTVLLYINKKLSFCQVLATESFIIPSERGCEKFSKANFHTKKSPKRAKYQPKQSKVFLSLLFWPELMKNILIMPPSVHYRTTTTAREWGRVSPCSAWFSCTDRRRSPCSPGPSSGRARSRPSGTCRACCGRSSRSSRGRL